nr:hypothetical protein [Rhodococcus sp. (in: high G+C Gram-positive bacteria)]
MSSSTFRVSMLLWAVVIAGTVAFVLAPAALAGGQYGSYGDSGPLADAFTTQFVGYWNGDREELPSSLTSIVDYWFRYHLAKAVIAAMVLGVLALIGARQWRTALSAPNPRSLVPFLATSILALASSVLVAANIQGAVAPFSSLMPFLASDGTPEMQSVFVRVTQALGDPSASPPLAVMIADFSRYHVALAVVGTVVALALGAASVLSWRRFAITSAAQRRTYAAAGSTSVLITAITLVVVVANVTNAVDPEHGLLMFFGAR